jgi:5-(carboxyamino)imidazole ribonucleotide synthase
MAAPILPGSTIGILGGGQLGRMLVLEARRMGYRSLVLDPSPDAPACQVADEFIAAPLGEVSATRELASRSDVVTIEWENAEVDAMRELEGLAPLRPAPAVLEVAQHRLREKDAARRAGLGTTAYHAVGTVEELHSALEEIGGPAILKTCRGGYDGLGQVALADREAADEAFRTLGGGSTELILEARVPFRLELSVICARRADGESICYPVSENTHVNGILESTVVPARIPDRVAIEAQHMAERFAESLGVIGLLAVELFLTNDDTLLVNEIAPRPHNSGHYSWEATTVSQFEQHIRSICDLPLGSTDLLRPAAMVNLLGHEIGTGLGLAATPDALRHPATALHIYGKAEARAGRKMGHLTVLGHNAEEALLAARRAKAALVKEFGLSPERRLQPAS